MATTAISGKNGSITPTGTGAVGAEVKSWDNSTELDLEDATSFDSAGWKEFVAGLSGSSGSFSAVGSVGTLGDVTSLQLDTGTDVGTDLRISGAAFINVVGTTTPVDGIVEYTGTYTFTGAVTFGTVTA
jgi:hypothetical protein